MRFSAARLKTYVENSEGQEVKCFMKYVLCWLWYKKSSNVNYNANSYHIFDI